MGEWAYFSLNELRRHSTNVPTWVYEMGESVMFNLYTGLTDTNSKEIFEGDLATAVFKDGSTYDSVAEVSFSEGVYWIGMGMLRDAKDIEIIGNVYENSELLKGGSV